ncbi:MAG: NAD-dependent dehydratase, partial [Chloroflexi bacterium]|nr:NAD-dependent dehydratase [Chloroflexota bacterium]
TELEARTLVDTFRGLAGRIVVISSQDVYRAYGVFYRSEEGPVDPPPATEDSPLREKLYPYRGDGRGLDDYEKILVERAVTDVPGLPATVLRLPMVYGEGDYQHRLLFELQRMDDGRPAILLEERFARWRWTRGYVENIAAAIALAVTDARATGRVYNLGEPNALAYADWVRVIGRNAGWARELLLLPEDRLPKKLRPLSANYEQHLVADTGRIRVELGQREPVARDEALVRTIAWERKHRPGDVGTLLDYAGEDAALAALRPGPQEQAGSSALLR